jgi:hypothetical protein
MTITPRTVRRTLGFGALILTVACGGGGAAYDYATTTSPSPYSSEERLNDALLDAVWADRTPSERASVCAEVRLRGAAPSAAIVLSGLDDPSFTLGQIADKLEGWCL